MELPGACHLRGLRGRLLRVRGAGLLCVAGARPCSRPCNTPLREEPGPGVSSLRGRKGRAAVHAGGPSVRRCACPRRGCPPRVCACPRRACPPLPASARARAGAAPRLRRCHGCVTGHANTWRLADAAGGCPEQ